MKSGFLSQYFESVVAKKLSSVEVNLAKSHQHEFNGSVELKMVLGTHVPQTIITTFMWIEEQNAAFSEDGKVTWYDARANHPARSEFRLYFPQNSVMQKASEGDTIFIAKRTDGTLLIVLTLQGSTIERQLYWLFGLNSPQLVEFEYTEIDQLNDHELDFAARFILDELGIDIEEPENDLLDHILEHFVGVFPSTAEFSLFARNSLSHKEFNIADDPDHALITFMNWEEKLFRRLERHNVSVRLQEGFSSEQGQDVESFIRYSLSIQNRRKVRAGSAFEEHVKFILTELSIKFSKGNVTENKSKPDFVFPSIEHYKSTQFPTDLLTILGAKTSLKDRWRQVLSEADRIPKKHLLTLEPGISENQTAEMIASQLQLIVPRQIHQTFTENQQSWLMNFKEFIQMVAHKQSAAAALYHII